MTNPQRLLVAAVFVLAVLGGVALGLGLGRGGDADAPASPVAGASAQPSAATPGATPASEAPSEQASPAPSPSAGVSQAPPSSPASAATPSPRPTTGPGEPTTVVVTALKLDAADDPDGRDRRITFRSQGTGEVRVDLRALSPQGNAVVCLSAGGQRVACETTGNGTVGTATTTRREDFELTLRGDGIDATVVEVTITFPARTPSITIENARFDGTAFPETNGLQVLVAPRADGELTLEASWGGHPLSYEVDLLEQGGPGSQILADQGPATGVATALPVTAANPWKLLLQNIQEGFGVTPLEATIAWP